MTEERRSNKRKLLLLEAKWESMSRTHEARVDDASLGGCFVNTFGRVELNEPVNLQIMLPSGEWLSLSGRVASYQPGVGFGMCFDSLTEEKLATLEELIATTEERHI
ncbi:MAG TPA: PilZ domain-containing protein [Pyrinomonadaceae bacterium]|nr:PilZ domain-containing protein [Pyrinomonadaceae bacterium]